MTGSAVSGTLIAMKNNYSIALLVAACVLAVFAEPVFAKGLRVPSLLGRVISVREEGDVIAFTFSGTRSWLDGQQVHSKAVKDFSMQVKSDAIIDTYVPREDNGKYVPFVQRLSFEKLKQMILDAKNSGHEIRIDINEPKMDRDANEGSLRAGMMVDRTALSAWLNKRVETNR